MASSRILPAVALAAAFFVPARAQTDADAADAASAAPAPSSSEVAAPAAPGPWSARLRATYLQMANKSSGALGTDVISVSDKWLPEFDVGYRINDSWSLELVLTVPQEHQVNLEGAGEIGDFEELPPTFFVQYHPKVSEVFLPYVGAGVNVTFIMDDDLLNGAAKLDSVSVGPAAQAGFDLKLNERWALNFDFKWIMIRSDVEVAGAKVAEAKLDPLAYSVGATYRF